jgi:hypothetical protein
MRMRSLLFCLVTMSVAVAACSGSSSPTTKPSTAGTPSTAATSQQAATSTSPGPAGPTHAALTVHPASGLRDGENVKVAVRGFNPGTKVYLSQCAPGQRPSAQAGCGQQLAAEPLTFTDGSGSRAGTPFRVHATVHGQACEDACRIAASDGRHVAAAKIAFS